ncbi:MAG: Holliday junction resolvase RuvX [Alphaproteobacteria bacterium]|nr:Holliday junction resolvase RuvX [Alphaproteobacteria bacterium]
MILPDFKDFPKVGRILGIDWGARRTGVAISDESRQMVFARPVMGSIPNKSIAEQIATLVGAERVAGIVIGLPLRMDGTESDTTDMVRAFANDLAGRVNVPICFVDETLTSLSAQESMGRVRVRDIKQKLDSESARVILENAISMIKRL